MPVAFSLLHQLAPPSTDTETAAGYLEYIPRIHLNHVPWAVVKENGGKENGTGCHVTHKMVDGCGC
jgi:hypothetical protein